VCGSGDDDVVRINTTVSYTRMMDIKKLRRNPTATYTGGNSLYYRIIRIKNIMHLQQTSSNRNKCVIRLQQSTRMYTDVHVSEELVALESNASLLDVCAPAAKD
jgi:hypothetical protein